MGYIEQSSSGDEKIIAKFGIHWISFVFPIIFSFMIIGLPSLIRLIFTEYGVTTKRIVLKKGFIARRTEEMKNAKVETVEISQGILGRILGYGDIKVTGQGISNVVFKTVSSPLKAKMKIEEAIG
tara:strand:- start:22 stop:396 length:375 start_codon:yes stop_codon:yes gene_type:complete